MCLECFTGHVFGERTITRPRFQVAHKFLAEFSAVLFVAGNGAENFEHFLGQSQFGLTSLLGVKKELPFDLIANLPIEARLVRDEVLPVAVLHDLQDFGRQRELLDIKFAFRQEGVGKRLEACDIESMRGKLVLGCSVRLLGVGDPFWLIIWKQGRI